MRDDFGEARRGDRPGSARLGNQNLGGMREKLPSHFVDSFIAKRSIEKPNFPSGEILFEKKGEFARGPGIVRPIEKDVGAGLQFFEAPGPNRAGDSPFDGFVGNAKALLLEASCSSESAERIFQLEAPGKTRGDVERRTRRNFGRTGMKAPVLLGFLVDAKELGRLPDGTFQFSGVRENDFTSLRLLRGQNQRHSPLEDSGLLASNFL